MIGILFWDSAGAISDANDALLRLVGYSREDLDAGRVSWLEMTPPDERHLDERALESLRTHGLCEPYEKHYIRKDGTRVPIVIGAALIDGSRDTASPTCRTSRRGAKPRPAARERGAVPQPGGASPLIMWVVEADGRCTYVNQYWYEFSGVPTGEDSGAGSTARCIPTTRRPAWRRSATRGRVPQRAIATSSASGAATASTAT
jgi:PAS domain S-box-containing protein